MIPLQRRHHPWPLRSDTTWAPQQLESRTSGQAGVWLHMFESLSPCPIPPRVRTFQLLLYSPIPSGARTVAETLWKSSERTNQDAAGIVRWVGSVHVHVDVVPVLEDRRVARALGWVVVAPAVAGLRSGAPDPVVEDDGLDREPVGLADEVLRD